MLAKDLVIYDADSPLWSAIQPVFTVAQQLERNDESYSWHGWRKEQITSFLCQLPAHCSLLVGVWDTGGTGIEAEEGQEQLVLGCVCEVAEGEIRSLHTFDALTDPQLPPIQALEPGYQHALALLRAARNQVAPVAWALFTDKTTWEEWLFAQSKDGNSLDKGEYLADLAQQGRCVLMGSQTSHHHL